MSNRWRVAKVAGDFLWPEEQVATFATKKPDDPGCIPLLMVSMVQLRTSCLFPLRLFFGGESCVFLILAFADRGPLFLGSLFWRRRSFPTF